MSLSVLVKSASNLPNVEKFSKSDPMCVIVLQGKSPLSLGPHYLTLTPSLPLSGEKKKTKVIDNNLDPQWNEVNDSRTMRDTNARSTAPSSYRPNTHTQLCTCS